MRRLIVWLIAAFVPAAIGAAFPAPDYYARLAKPAWAPPPWLFAFFGRRALAGTLLLPYLAWVTFAAALNFEIWRLNR